MAPDSGMPQPQNAAIGSKQRLTLHLGMLEQPYDTPGKRSSRPMTTYDVARILERNYGIMQMFYDAHEKDIGRDIEHSLGGALESLMMGQKVDPWGSAMGAIKDRFSRFLSAREVERVGFASRTRVRDRALLQIPTKAALKGIRHRFGKVIRGDRRPSFIDIGLYETSFRAWVS